MVSHLGDIPCTFSVWGVASGPVPKPPGLWACLVPQFPQRLSQGLCEWPGPNHSCPLCSQAQAPWVGLVQSAGPWLARLCSSECSGPQALRGCVCLPGCGWGLWVLSAV